VIYGNGREEMGDEVVVVDNITMLNFALKGFWIMSVGTLIDKVKGHFTYELKEIMFCEFVDTSNKMFLMHLQVL